MYSSLIRSEQPLYSIFPIYAYSSDGLYSVVVIENGTVCKAVSYSQNREAEIVLNLHLVKIEDNQDLLGKSLSELEELLGEYHVDIGSGFFIPSYFTVDGYLVSFTLSDNVISHIGKTDLLTGDPVEWYH